ncbi:MAG TPA: lytic transglycosylase domain-containing protein [Ktedonobacteraceae bacterium]
MRQGVQQTNPISHVAERKESAPVKTQPLAAPDLSAVSGVLQPPAQPPGLASRLVAPGLSAVSGVPQPPSQPFSQPLSQAPGSASRQFIVIRAEKKRARKAPASVMPGRRLSSRLRQSIVILVTVLVFAGTLATLLPLASGQDAWNISVGVSSLIRSARIDFQGLPAQNNSQPAAKSSGLPAMNIPHNQLVALAEQDATDAGISPIYFVRQINLESGFNPNAVSPSGAEGIAQFEPATAAGLGIDPFNPTQALKAAAQMMGRYSKQYGGYDKALAAYNAGPASLQHAENACGANWLSCMPPETQHYIATIMGN